MATPTKANPAIKHKPPPPLVPLGINILRRIRFKLFIGGIALPLIKSWTKDESAYGAGTNMSCVIRMNPTFDLYAKAQEAVRKGGPLTIQLLTTMTVKDRPDLSFVDMEEFSGIVDEVTGNYNDGTYTVAAKSYAQILANEKVNDVVVNKSYHVKTTSQVVVEYTKKFGKGLKTVDKNGVSTVDNFPTTLGGIYKDQVTRAATNLSVWDLFESFAQKDNADLYVKGDVLYYRRQAPDLNPNITELKNSPPNLTYTWGVDIQDLNVRHAPMFSHDITVTVTSYNPKTKNKVEVVHNMTTARRLAIAETLKLTSHDADRMDTKAQAKYRERQGVSPSSGQITAGKIGNKSNYSFFVENASREDCDRIAAKIMADISAKEFNADVVVAARPDATVQHYIRLAGCPHKSVNQVYAIKNLRTSFGMPDKDGKAQGYLMTLVLVNHSVQSSGTSLGV